jgi:hypothetical protein
MIMRMNRRRRLNREYQLNLGSSYGFDKSILEVRPLQHDGSMVLSKMPQETYLTGPKTWSQYVKQMATLPPKCYCCQLMKMVGLS